MTIFDLPSQRAVFVEATGGGGSVENECLHCQLNVFFVFNLTKKWKLVLYLEIFLMFLCLFKCAATLCKKNEHVSNHICAKCSAGMENAKNDDASGADTTCDPKTSVTTPQGSDS